MNAEKVADDGIATMTVFGEGALAGADSNGRLIACCMMAGAHQPYA
jgi:hypothetical protein